MNPNEYKSTWEYRIKEVFKKREASSDNILWNIVNLILYSGAKDRVLIDIYNLFDDKNDFVKLISLLDGRTFKSPTKEELEDALLLAVLYYEKNICKKNWSEIRDSLDFKISSIKYGIKINNLSNFIKQKINEILGVKDNG